MAMHPAKIVSSQAPEFSAKFMINGAAGNVKITVGGTVALQAEHVSENVYYAWHVTCAPYGCDYVLSNTDLSQAMLTLKTPGVYIVQLTVDKADETDVVRHIVWATSEQRKYCLPATGEPLRFSGDEGWAGDLLTVIRDVEDYLPSPNQKAALAAANAPSATNPVATLADIGLIRVVAAGVIDLRQSRQQARPPYHGHSFGGLRVLENHVDQGWAILTFDKYASNAADTFLVNALPVNEEAGQPARPIISVQFVSFTETGFKLQMVDLGQLPVGRPALGRCMLEVKQITQGGSS